MTPVLFSSQRSSTHLEVAPSSHDLKVVPSHLKFAPSHCKVVSSNFTIHLGVTPSQLTLAPSHPRSRLFNLKVVPSCLIGQSRVIPSNLVGGSNAPSQLSSNSFRSSRNCNVAPSSHYHGRIPTPRLFCGPSSLVPLCPLGLALTRLEWCFGATCREAKFSPCDLRSMYIASFVSNEMLPGYPTISGLLGWERERWFRVSNHC